MAVTLNTDGFAVNFAASIDKRLIVDRVDGTTSSLVSLEPNYNYRNMYVWVREEKSFYYLIDSPEEGGATVSDWTQASGGVGGSASAIDLTEVAFGTGTGITSSNNFTFINDKTNLMSATGSTISSSYVYNSSIIGGDTNQIFPNSYNSSIIGGKYNKLGAETTYNSTIVGGTKNCLGYQDFNNSILGGCCNFSNWAYNSSIIAGYCNKINSGGAESVYMSTILGGSKNKIIGTISNSSIISSEYSCLELSNNSTILGGQSNTLCFNSCNSAIIGGVGLTLSNECSVVYVPRLKIATASNSDSVSKVLVWDTTDNYVKWRSSSTLGSASTTPDSLINAKKVAWEDDNSFPTMPGQLSSWGLTAGQDPNTVIFYNGNNRAFDSPQGDIVVSLNPATATLGLNRDFKLILGNGGRVETGNTWSVAYNGTRLVEYGEGRIEPHVLDFSWATSSEVPNGEYLLTKYVVDVPVDDFTTTGAAFGRDFTIKRQDLAFFTGIITVFNNIGVGSSGIFPKGSILFVDESFVTCEGITGSVTGVNVSFGLSTVTSGGSIGSAISNFEPQLSEFGISNSYEMLFPPKALGDFFTGSIFYSKSPIGIVRLTQPAMLVIRPVGGNIAIGTRLKYRIPYIVDEASVNSISGTNFIAAPANSSTGCAKSGYVSGTSFAGTGTSSVSVVFSTPYSSASYSVVVTSQAFTTTDYVYSVTDKTASGFIIRTPSTGPIGATAMWITNCYDGSGLSSGGGGAQGPTGPGGGSVIDLEEIAFGTGTGITSSNLFTFNNTNTSLILGFDNTITNSRSSAIIGGTANTINNSTASSILSNNNTTIHKSFYSTSISNYSSTICGSKNSNIISSYFGFMTQSNYSSIISTYNSSICESNFSVILGGGCGNVICSPNLGSPHYGGIVFGGGNLICDSPQSAIFNSSKSCIAGSISNLNGQNNILGGVCNEIFYSRSSGIIGGFCSSLSSTTLVTCFNSIFYSSHSQIIGNTSSRFNIIMGSTGSYIQSMMCSGKGGSDRNTNNSLIIGGNCNTILGACNSLILGGSGITIIGQTTSLSIVGKNNRIDNVVAVPSLRGFGSLSLSVSTASNTTYPSGVCLDDNFFTLIAYPDDPGNLNVCLPYADALGRLYVIKKAGTSTYSTVTVRTRGSDCIDGYSGDIELINPWDYYMLQADGVDNWIKLGGAVGINL